MIAGFTCAVDILSQSMMQLSVPDRLRGRAMGGWVVAVGAGPIGHLELGLLIATFSVATGLAINGTALVLVGLVALAGLPRLRRL